MAFGFVVKTVVKWSGSKYVPATITPIFPPPPPLTPVDVTLPSCILVTGMKVGVNPEKPFTLAMQSHLHA